MGFACVCGSLGRSAAQASAQGMSFSLALYSNIQQQGARLKLCATRPAQDQKQATLSLQGWALELCWVLNEK